MNTPKDIEAFLTTTGPMVVVNLPQRDDRRTEFRQQLERLGLSFDHPKVDLFPAIRPDTPNGFPNIGTRGCFLSHLTLLRNTMECGQDSVLVCEDDLDFAADFLPRLPETVHSLQSAKWDIFYGGYESALQSGPGVATVPAESAMRCTHFYSIRGPALADLVAYLETILTRPPGHPDGGPMHVDGAISRFRADHPQYITLAAAPPLGRQRPSRTDIHDLQWYDRWPATKGFVSFLRRNLRP